MRRSLTPWSRQLPRPFEDLAREMDGLMHHFFGEESGRWSDWGQLSPTTNMAETDTAYEVSVDLPGMGPEEVKIELKEGHLVVFGERKQETEEEGKTFHLTERRYGQFRRSIPLPGSVEEDKIKAQYKDGVLTITLPRTEEAKTRRIDAKWQENRPESTQPTG